MPPSRPTGKEGVITDMIPAIKADKSLKLEAKKALIALVRSLRDAADLKRLETFPNQILGFPGVLSPSPVR